MDDIIWRQDAINVLWEEPSYSDSLNVLAEARDRISALQPAHQLYDEEWRKKYYEISYNQGFLDGYKMCEKRLPRWTPCSEGLPEEKDAGIIKKLGVEKRSEDVLVTVEVKGERMTVTACTYDGKWEWDMKYTFPDFKVVAWMPMPEPYKGGD